MHRIKKNNHSKGEMVAMHYKELRLRLKPDEVRELTLVLDYAAQQAEAQGRRNMHEWAVKWNMRFGNSGFDGGH